ncbi:hypothetical protein E4U55_003037 [Claviceps digitariae]|nr:hypothetical protein E4U55_003037 [Claviceps digitariae]
MTHAHSDMLIPQHGKEISRIIATELIVLRHLRLLCGIGLDLEADKVFEKCHGKFSNEIVMMLTFHARYSGFVVVTLNE